MPVGSEAKANVDIILTKYRVPLEAGVWCLPGACVFSLRHSGCSEAVLMAEIGQRYFEAHLRREYSEENLLVRLWFAVHVWI